MNKWTDPIRESKASTASAWGKNREIARKLLMKAKIYRALAFFFALIGVGMVIQSYLSHIDGHFFDAIRNPYTIVMILLPFLPAFVLSLMAQKSERDFAKLKPYEKPGDKNVSADKNADVPARK